MTEDGELLAEGEDLKVQSCPASNRSSQGMGRGNQDGSHDGTLQRSIRKSQGLRGRRGFLQAQLK